MPRTKQVKKQTKPKDSLASLKEADIDANALEEVNRRYKVLTEELLEERAATFSALNRISRQNRLAIPVALANTKMKDLRNESTWKKLNSINSLSMLNSVLLSKVDSNNKTTGAKDDGYVTSESSSCSSGGYRASRTAKRSSSFSKRTRSSSMKTSTKVKRLDNSTVRKSTRQSRSLSRSIMPSSKPVPKKGPQTPLSKSKSVKKSCFTPQNTNNFQSFGMITPKVKPNTPHIILRRPQQGELAISMQGSPLMTTAMVTETTANVNIPLPDGRMINLQPMRGLRASDVPELDPEIQRQLQTLRDNLEKVCKFSSSK